MTSTTLSNATTASSAPAAPEARADIRRGTAGYAFSITAFLLLLAAWPLSIVPAAYAHRYITGYELQVQIAEGKGLVTHVTYADVSLDTYTLLNCLYTPLILSNVALRDASGSSVDVMRMYCTLFGIDLIYTGDLIDPNEEVGC